LTELRPDEKPAERSTGESPGGRPSVARDLRSYAQQTQARLIVGAMLILFIIGDGLIYLIYGPPAALMGLVCLGGGLLPVIAIILILWGIDWVVKRANQD
jgi:hypothetical protein